MVNLRFYLDVLIFNGFFSWCALLPWLSSTQYFYLDVHNLNAFIWKYLPYMFLSEFSHLKMNSSSAQLICLNLDVLKLYLYLVVLYLHGFITIFSFGVIFCLGSSFWPSPSQPSEWFTQGLLEWFPSGHCSFWSSCQVYNTAKHYFTLVLWVNHTE